MNLDYNKIDAILNKYFEGTTSLAEEDLLRQYFASGFVADKHYPYKALFDYTRRAKAEISPQPVTFKSTNNRQRIYFSAVASLVLAIGFVWFIQQKHLPNVALSGLSTKVKQIEVSGHKRKEAEKEIKKFANHVEKGVQNISALSIFAIATQKVFKIKKSSKKSNK